MLTKNDPAAPVGGSELSDDELDRIFLIAEVPEENRRRVADGLRFMLERWNARGPELVNSMVWMQIGGHPAHDPDMEWSREGLYCAKEKRTKDE